MATQAKELLNKYRKKELSFIKVQPALFLGPGFSLGDEDATLSPFVPLPDEARGMRSARRSVNGGLH